MAAFNRAVSEALTNRLDACLPQTGLSIVQTAGGTRVVLDALISDSQGPHDGWVWSRTVVDFDRAEYINMAFDEAVDSMTERLDHAALDHAALWRMEPSAIPTDPLEIAVRAFDLLWSALAEDETPEVHVSVGPNLKFQVDRDEYEVPLDLAMGLGPQGVAQHVADLAALAITIPAPVTRHDFECWPDLFCERGTIAPGKAAQEGSPDLSGSGVVFVYSDGDGNGTYVPFEELLAFIAEDPYVP